MGIFPAQRWSHNRCPAWWRIFLYSAAALFDSYWGWRDEKCCGLFTDKNRTKNTKSGATILYGGRKFSASYVREKMDAKICSFLVPQKSLRARNFSRTMLTAGSNASGMPRTPSSKPQLTLTEPPITFSSKRHTKNAATIAFVLCPRHHFRVLGMGRAQPLRAWT